MPSLRQSRPLLAHVAALLVALPCAAQSSATAAPSLSDAERVARTAFDALAAGRYREAAALVHPRAAAGFREAHLERLRMQEEADRQVVTPADTSMPPAVQAWFAEQRRRHATAPAARLGYEFADVRSARELEALDEVEVLARWFEAHDPVSLYRQALERAGMRAQADSLRGPDARARADSSGGLVGRRASEWSARRRVLGAVPHDDSTALVAYVVTLPGADAGDAGTPFEGRASLLTLRRAGSTWRLWTGGTFDNALLADMGGWTVGVMGPQEIAERGREAARTVVRWPAAAGVREGRAFVADPREDGGAPRAVAIEGRDARGRTVRVEIPPSAFLELAGLLHTWPTPAVKDASPPR